ncbi:MAG TPA: multidrug ABC transporter ATP-binding protein, partial [Ruminococcaceae bacterium]|nr:multidrug ABC transporter ATP-binding protein [Oscillospiraceae bacterium]
FNENSLGTITSVTTNTMDNLSGVSTRVVMLVTEGIFSTAVMTLAVFLFDWRVGLLIVAGLAVYSLINRAMQAKSEKTTRRKLAGDTAVVGRVLEYIKGIAEVKSYSLIGKYNRKLESAINENVDSNIDMELKLLPLMFAQNAVAKLIDVGVVLLSLVLYTSGHMALLNCVMLCICSFLLTEGLEQAGTQSSLLRVVDTCVNQANDILNLPTMDTSGAEIMPENYDIRAENISFSYGEKPIIDGITLDIPEKSTTAIVGPSGGGKTTLCHLLSRFWDVDAGKVTLGGRDVREYDMDSLMRNFSFVFQNVYLFHDTIANNIRFGQSDVPMEQVIAAAKKARCHDFIMKLPQGYETVIGEAGGTLSGGERQLLSIARAMMKDAPIIILDEATANVDPENEKELMEAISELTQEKTVIMIAHRLKTVRGADQILVVDKGQIVQHGTHDELMGQDGIYRRFISGREQAVGWKL